jgi:hypothetical protein
VFGNKRNRPIVVPAENPKPEPRKVLDVGDAGQDGYSVLSRAGREGGRRPAIGGHPAQQGPRYDQEQ